MAKAPLPGPSGFRAPAAVAQTVHMMPTHAELTRQQAEVDLPDCLTGGVLRHQLLKYCMPLLHIIVTEKFTGDKFPEQADSYSRLAAAVEAFNHAYRVVDSFFMGDVVRDATLRPYSKVFTRAYLTVRCLFCYSFV